MILQQLHIYGFGKLSNKKVTLSPGLNIIEGKNEAGKSTLMAFIRGILFGFEGRRTPHLRYEPLDGGKFGGAIDFIDEHNQIYRMERVFQQKVSGDVTIYLPSGEQAGEEVLPRLLGKINDKIYKNILSFGLTELQQIESLQDEQINDYLYHAGTGVVQQILKLKQYLDQKQQQLFKPSGSKPQINRIVQQLEVTHQSISLIKQKHENHGKIIKEIKGLEQKIIQLEKEIERKKADLNWLEKAEQYKPYYKRIVEINLLLKEYPDTFSFPNHGVERINNVLNKINDLTAEKEQVEKKKTTLQKELENITFDPLDEGNIDQIRQIINQFASYQEQVKSYRALMTEVEHLQEKINQQLQVLGPAFSEAKIKQMEISLLDKQNIQDLAERLEEKVKRLDDVKKEIEMKEGRYKQLEQMLQRLQLEENRSSDQEPKEERLKQYLKTWDRIKEKKWFQKQLEEQKRTFASYAATLEKKHSFHLIFYLTNSGLLTISLILFFYREWFYGGLTALFALLVFLIFIISKRKGTVEHIKKQLKRIDQEMEQTEKEINRLSFQAKEWITPFGFDLINEETTHKIEELREKLIQEKQVIREKENRIKDYEREMEWVQAEIERLEQSQKKSLLYQIEQLNIEWKDWLSAHHLPSNISSLILFETISMIQSTKEWMQKRDEMKKKMEKIEEDIRKFEHKVARLKRETNLDQSKTVEESIYALAEKLKESEEAKVNAKYLNQRLDEVKQQVEQFTQKLSIEEKNLDSLLQHAQASNIEQFYEIASRYNTYQELIKEKKQLSITIQSACRKERKAEELFQALKAWDQDELLEQIETSKRDIEKRKQDLKKAVEEKGQLLNQIKEMENDRTLSDLNQTFEQLQAELSSKAKEWSALQLTKHILEKTMKVYEMEKQPQVMKRASAYFALLTGNRYKTVIAPLGTNKLDVIRHDGQRMNPQYLSRGTIEQLFIAIRFALIEAFLKNISLPVILDDVFVNFDHERLTYAIKSLKELVDQNQQVLFFTCHQHVSEAMRREIDSFNHFVLG